MRVKRRLQIRRACGLRKLPERLRELLLGVIRVAELVHNRVPELDMGILSFGANRGNAAVLRVLRRVNGGKQSDEMAVLSMSVYVL